MKQKQTLALLEHFAILPDPRRQRHNTKRHELIDILIIAVIACLCGADTWVEIEEFGQEKESWLSQLLQLPNGIPSHDTFGRVFSLINPDAFEACFTAWTRTLISVKKNTIVALDGKSVRRSKTSQQKPLHLVNAFATETGITLGQRKVDGKSNEISAVPELLDLLVLKGCIITADAMSCQASIVQKVIKNKANYVFAVKNNQARLRADIAGYFQEGTPERISSSYEESEQGHGRVEMRSCIVSTNLSSLRDLPRWDGLRGVSSK